MILGTRRYEPERAVVPPSQSAHVSFPERLTLESVKTAPRQERSCENSSRMLVAMCCPKNRRSQSGTSTRFDRFERFRETWNASIPVSAPRTFDFQSTLHIEINQTRFFLIVIGGRQSVEIHRQLELPVRSQVTLEHHESPQGHHCALASPSESITPSPLDDPTSSCSSP